MTVESKCIKDIIKAASGSPDDMVRVLQANYEALDEKAAKKEYGGVFLGILVDAVFGVIDNSDDVVKDCRRGALIIAEKMDIDADGTEKNPYHNKLHAAKVVMNVFALALMQNASAEYGPKITAGRFAELLLAAVAHDLGHDGRGNGRGAEHKPYKLEQESIDMAVDWLRKAEPEKLEERVIRRCQNAFELIYATDVSTAGADDKQPSPAHIMRQLYDQPRHKMPDLSGLHPNLWGIASSRERIELAALLQDGDVTASVLTPEQSWIESRRVADEIGLVEVKSGFAASFLNGMLGRRMTTKVARILCDKNILSILDMAEQGIVAGMPVPKAPGAPALPLQGQRL